VTCDVKNVHSCRWGVGGGRAEGLMCADPGCEHPIGVSGIFSSQSSIQSKINRHTEMQTDKQTHGQTNRPKDIHMDKNKVRQTDPRTDRPTDRQTDPRTDKKTQGQTDPWTDRQNHGQTDRPTDRQTSSTYIEVVPTQKSRQMI
jgi:hypothetical protein